MDREISASVQLITISISQFTAALPVSNKPLTPQERNPGKFNLEELDTEKTISETIQLLNTRSCLPLFLFLAPLTK